MRFSRVLPRVLMVCALLGLMVTSAPAFAAAPPGPSPASAVPQRLAGATRAGTALSIAEATYPTGVPSGTAIITAGNQLFDTLVAGPLAYALHAPILLARNPNHLGSTTRRGLQHLGVTRLILVGSMANGAVAQQPPGQLTVAAVYGTGRSPQASNPELTGIAQLTGAPTTVAATYDPRAFTAAAVARALLAATGQSAFSTVAVTANRTANVVDALSIGPVAAERGAPILLAPPASSGTSALPAVEVPLAAQVHQVIQVGAMSAATIRGIPATASIQRLGGATRFATSKTIDAAYFSHPSRIFLANGQPAHLVDAATATPLAAVEQAPILLVNNGVLQASDLTYLQLLTQLTGTQFTILGGTASIPHRMRQRLQQVRQQEDQHVSSSDHHDRPDHQHPSHHSDN